MNLFKKVGGLIRDPGKLQTQQAWISDNWTRLPEGPRERNVGWVGYNCLLDPDLDERQIKTNKPSSCSQGALNLVDFCFN